MMQGVFSLRLAYGQRPRCSRPGLLGRRAAEATQFATMHGRVDKAGWAGRIVTMQAWWSALDISLQIFYVIGIAAGIFLILQVMLAMVGGDHGADGVGDHPDGLGILSHRTITGFFFGFGWTGVLCLRNGLSVPAAIVCAASVGAAFLFGIYFLMRVLYSLRSSGTLDYKNAVGQTATVYVTVPAGMAGSGQVEVMIQGRLAVVAAMTRRAEPIPPGTKVSVSGLIDRGTLEIQTLNAP